MINSKLKLKLKARGAPSVGTWLTLGNPDIAEIMVRAGFEWVAVDLEHSYIGLDRMGELLRVIELAGATPLVRLSSNDQVLIKRVMDSGAHGIIVPMVNSREDALAAYKAMHYAPTGVRGVGLARAQGYGANFQEYRKALGDSAVLIPQIEHISAVNNLESILGLEEVDAFMVGPYDLSGSLGVAGDFTHPKFTEAIDKIERIAKKIGKPAGVHIVEPNLEELKKAIAKDYKFIAYSVDIRVLEYNYSLAARAARADV